MPPHTEVYLAVPFEVSYEANEPLIAAGDAEEDEDHRLEEKAFSRFKFSSLLLGLLAGFGMQFSIVGAHLLVILLFGEDLATDSKTTFFVFCLLWTFVTADFLICNWNFLCNLVTITYWTVCGRSQDLLKELGSNLRFNVGVCLAWTITGAILGMRTQTSYASYTLALAIIVFALVYCSIVVMSFATDADRKPPSSRRSTAKQTMTADV